MWILSIVAGLLRALADRILWGYKNLWLWRFEWFRSWRDSSVALVHIPLDAWHMVQIFGPAACFAAGWYAVVELTGATVDPYFIWVHTVPPFIVEIEAVWMWTFVFWIVYSTIKTIFYEWLLMDQPFVWLMKFIKRTTETPFKED